MSLQYVAGNTPGRDHTYRAVVNRDRVGYFNLDRTATVPVDALYGLIVPEIDDGQPNPTQLLTDEIERIYPIELSLSEMMFLNWHIKTMTLSGSWGFHYSQPGTGSSFVTADDDQTFNYEAAMIKSAPAGSPGDFDYQPCVNPIDLLGISTWTQIGGPTFGMNQFPENRPFRQLVKNIGFMGRKNSGFPYQWEMTRDDRSPGGCSGFGCTSGTIWRFSFGLSNNPVEAIFFPETGRFRVNLSIRIVGNTVNVLHNGFPAGSPTRQWTYANEANGSGPHHDIDTAIGTCTVTVIDDHTLPLIAQPLGGGADAFIVSRNLDISLVPDSYFAY